MGTLEAVTQVMATSMGCNMLTTLRIAPKKTKGEKMDLGTFLTDSSMSWSLCRTNEDITSADEASSPGFMGR